MHFNEIKIRGIYKVSIEVDIRGKGHTEPVDFLIFVTEKANSCLIGARFLTGADFSSYWFEPHQLKPV